MKKNSLNLIVGLLMMVALGGALLLVKQNQNTQRGAYFAGTKLLVQPSEVSGGVGSEVLVQLFAETENNAKISSLDTVVCFGSNLKITNPATQVVFNEEALKTKVESSQVTVNGKSCLRLIAISDVSAKPEDLKGGMVKLATIKFEGDTAGSGTIEYLSDKTKLGGYNPEAGATDTALKVSSATSATYTIGDSVTPTQPVTGDTPILNYKVSFGNEAGDSKCMVNWPMQIIVLSNGESKAYSGVKASTVTKSGNKTIFSGTVALTGFNHTNNVAAFIKGPKHLQMKYAIQNQSGPYNKAGGELTLTTGTTVGTVYDFSGYPMIPGDVMGSSSDNPDGWIDGVDFAYVKSKSLTHETVADGGYLKADLDGNCQVNSNDVNVLKISLQTKQGQLY